MLLQLLKFFLAPCGFKAPVYLYQVKMAWSQAAIFSVHWLTKQVHSVVCLKKQGTAVIFFFDWHLMSFWSSVIRRFSDFGSAKAAVWLLESVDYLVCRSCMFYTTHPDVSILSQQQEGGFSLHYENKWGLRFCFPGINYAGVWTALWEAGGGHPIRHYYCYCCLLLILNQFKAIHLCFCLSSHRCVCVSGI